MKSVQQKTLKQKGGSVEQSLKDIQKRSHYSFKNKRLLRQALTHSSYVSEQTGTKKEDNETLEFLGDAVLDLVVSNMLISNFPKMNEGELTKVRATLVQENHLAFMAREIGLGEVLFLGKGEENSGGRKKDSILACAYEALLGAIFRDGGYEKVRRVVEEAFQDRLDYGREKAVCADAKSRLQELTQERHPETPSYRVDKEEGPDHNKLFTVSVLFQGKVLASASAKSKKLAEQKAASIALNKFH